MFKKNPNRPSITVNLKKTSQGYKVVNNEAIQLFTAKKIVRSIYRPDLIQMSNQNLEGAASGPVTSGTMIQPPAHITIPAVTSWFKEEQIHPLEVQSFPEFFKDNNNQQIFSFSVKNSNLYLYYRNSMVNMWRQNAKKYLSPSLCRKTLLGDVSSIMRIHAFLENWGLINFPSKQHNKGIILSKPESLQCYVCQNPNSKIYYTAQIESLIFQICENCFQNECYPLSIKKEQFKKVYLRNHTQKNHEMNKSQLARMLEILNGIPHGIPRQRDRDVWAVIQKEFPEFTREQIIRNFLQIPFKVNMNSSIFQKNQDGRTIEDPQLIKQIQNIQQPSIFQDFENPILGSIAMSYYLWQRLKNEDSDNIQQNYRKQKLDKIFKTSEIHAKQLGKDQEEKIREMTKILCEVALSKIQLKSQFLLEYDKFIKEQQKINEKIFRNNLAECMRLKTRKINLQTCENYRVKNDIQQ